jgi:hypothetical protein
MTKFNPVAGRKTIANFVEAEAAVAATRVANPRVRRGVARRAA